MKVPSIFAALLIPSILMGYGACIGLVASGHPWWALAFVPGAAIATVVIRRLW